MDNAIPSRIFGFLNKYLPFSLIAEKDLMKISGQVSIRYLQAEELVFRQGQTPEPYIYIVHEGAIHLFREEVNENILVDQCDEGDVFGIRPLLAGQEYLLTAKAAEETLLYAIKIENLQPVIETQPKVAWYLAQNFAAGSRNRMENTHQSRIFLQQPALIEGGNQLIEIQSIEHSKTPVTCPPKTSIQEAALIMRKKAVGSIIIVDASFHPIGILTDRDLRNKVVTGELSPHENVTELMSHPVVTIAPNLTVADVQIAMMKHRIHHLCITESGKPDSKVSGIISEHDLLVIQGNNPAIFIREIRRSDHSEVLRRIRETAEALLYKYLLQGVSIHFISKMMTEVNDALIRKAIELSIMELASEGKPEPEVKWCWLALGSEGREEQLLRTDQDHALVFEDRSPSDHKSVKDYFLALAEKAATLLNYCGFEYCPAGMMASNPKWCLSLTEWKNQFSRWINTPTEKNVMFCTIFFDFRPIYGEFVFGEALSRHIFKTIASQSKFLTYLASHALHKPPPLTFFRNFVVEKSGEHKDEFDIKARAMMPLTDAARILILNAGEAKINNTFHRFERMAELEPTNKELFQQAADAYEILLRYRTLQGLKNKDDGRYFNPAELTKMERLNLRNSFQPIRELQDLLKVRFRTLLLM